MYFYGFSKMLFGRVYREDGVHASWKIGEDEGSFSGFWSTSHGVRVQEIQNS